MIGTVKTLVEGFQALGGKTALVADDADGDISNGLKKLFPQSVIVRLGHDLPFEPEELWLCQNMKFQLIVLDSNRTAKETYRILVLAERLLVPGGAIMVLAGEDRATAIEAFKSVYPGYVSGYLAGDIYSVQKEGWAGAVETKLTITSREGKKVISLALFGDNGYGRGLGAYVRAHHTLFTGWELRVHHDSMVYATQYGKLIDSLASRRLINAVQMTTREGQGRTEKMLWRMAPAWDKDVAWLFPRDLDALPTWTERAAVEEFMSSGATLHTIHANRAHVGIMGGLCGFDVSKFREAISFNSFEKFIFSAGYSDEKWEATGGADQQHLNFNVAPAVLAKGKIFEHSIFTQYAEDGKTRLYREPEFKSLFATNVAEYKSDEVSDKVKIESDKLIPYLGVAGSFNMDKVVSFYDKEGDPAVMRSVLEAEKEAGVFSVLNKQQ